ncbi:DUF7563 family protein [Halodesulfurarchaeum sp.]|uniref:DUF7563 family protein n=1 Tax=Halodesulfurarchaeum sp. TaxID=1980530 RepID=UPI003FA5EC19
MPRCNHCERIVTAIFARVFADETAEVRACPQCTSHATVAQITKERADQPLTYLEAIS